MEVVVVHPPYMVANLLHPVVANAASIALVILVAATTTALPLPLSLSLSLSRAATLARKCSS